MYFPETVRTSPAAAGFPQAQEVWLNSADGERVIAWHVPPRDDKPVVLYFHGNGGSLRLRVDRFQKIVAAGVGLVGLSYRGYGGSTGTPTEQGLIEDARAAYAFAAERYPGRIAVWGESLGTGVAVALASEKPVTHVDPRRAVHLDARCRGGPLLVLARAAPDEGPVPLRPAHQESEGAGADPARRRRRHHPDQVRRAAARDGPGREAPRALCRRLSHGSRPVRRGRRGAEVSRARADQVGRYANSTPQNG